MLDKPGSAEADPAGLVSSRSSTALVVQVIEHPQCFFLELEAALSHAQLLLEALVLKFEAFYFFLLSREPSLGAGRTLIKASEPARSKLAAPLLELVAVQAFLAQQRAELTMLALVSFV